jgi:hypothetical protein
LLPSNDSGQIIKGGPPDEAGHLGVLVSLRSRFYHLCPFPRVNVAVQSSAFAGMTKVPAQGLGDQPAKLKPLPAVASSVTVAPAT